MRVIRTNPVASAHCSLVVAAVLAAAAVAGCGDEPGEVAGGSGRLVVEHDYPPQPRYIEGAVSYVRLVRVETGETIVDRAVAPEQPRPGLEAPVYTRELPAAEYRLISYQRPCQGTCEMLDAPTDQCEATLDVAADGVVDATVELRNEGGCAIRVVAPSE